MESKALFRTFIAIPLEIPQFLKETMTHLKKEFQGERIRWVDPGQMHITLCFLGDVDRETVEAVTGKFGKTYESFETTSLRLHGLGTFSHRSELNVLWAGIEDPEVLRELYAATQQLLDEVGLRGESRSFKPHLTLARMKRLGDPGRFREKTAQFADIELGTCALEKVVFYRSILQTSGAVHEALASARL